MPLISKSATKTAIDYRSCLSPESLDVRFQLVAKILLVGKVVDQKNFLQNFTCGQLNSF
jgi:hypothetical protein